MFKNYLKYGYYPYYLSNAKYNTLFLQTLQQNINVSIESDLLYVYPKNSMVPVLKKSKLCSLLLSKSVPFEPNISEMKKAAEIADDRTLKRVSLKVG